MENVLILGAGNIGKLISCLLSSNDGYQVNLADLNIDTINKSKLGSCSDKITIHQIDASDKEKLISFIRKNNITTIISSLPYFCNIDVAIAASECNINYFDLTEDTKVSDKVKELSAKNTAAFVPQCGLAPGFINIAASDLIKKFNEVESVSMRVGALPAYPRNSLGYELTWSTDGLINEYGNDCYAINDGQKITLKPLEGHETVVIDGLQYEAFNTSGGSGTLIDAYVGKIKKMDYKTLRYPGHLEKIKFLMNDLRLNEDRDTLKKILEKAIPRTTQDVVLIYVNVKGKMDMGLYNESFVKKIYPTKIANQNWSAIQVSTASGICSVVDIVTSNKSKYKGFVSHEVFKISDVTSNRFGKCYV